MKPGVAKGVAALVMGWTQWLLSLLFTSRSLSLIVRQAQALLRFLFLFADLGTMTRFTFLSFGKHLVLLLMLTRIQGESLSETDLSSLLSHGFPPPTVVFSKEGRRIALPLASSRRKPSGVGGGLPGTHRNTPGSHTARCINFPLNCM